MEHKTQIYLDHAATTTTSVKVLSDMLPYCSGKYGNPSSLYFVGRNAKEVMDEKRGKIAEVLGVGPDEIIFTASGTESDNMAILGIARANREYGNHILVSSIEHKAVLEPAKQLAKEGFVVEFIPVDKNGLVSVEDIVSRITDKTILVSIMYANNEIGTIEPIKELGEAISKNRKQNNFPVFHTDACQAAGYLTLNVNELGVDAMTLNASKIYGPKGIGLLYKKKGIKIEPIIFGGGQEKGLRSGTENLPAIVGFTSALLHVEEAKEKEFERLTTLREFFIEKLKVGISDLVLNGDKEKRLPNNIHVSIPAIEGESMVLMLDELGIQASTGSACSASDLQVSHVLTAIKQDVNLMHGSIRFTMGEETTKADCEYVALTLSKIVERLKSISPLTKNYE